MIRMMTPIHFNNFLCFLYCSFVAVAETPAPANANGTTVHNPQNSSFTILFFNKFIHLVIDVPAPTIGYIFSVIIIIR